MKNPTKCSICKKLYMEHKNNRENICSECKIDEELHKYLQALRRKEGKLSFFEWLFLTIKG